MSSSLSDLLKSLKQATDSRRRLLRFANPSEGLLYNGLETNRIVSRRMYYFDLAHNPQVISNNFVGIDVHAKAWNANEYNKLTQAKSHKFYGRT